MAEELKVYTFEEVSQHNTRDNLWIVYEGKVYDCSGYLDEHPGGEEVILDCAGTDATGPFDDIGHSEDAREILAGLLIGKVEGPAVSNTSTETATKSESSSSVGLIAASAIVAIGIGAYVFLQQ